MTTATRHARTPATPRAITAAVPLVADWRSQAACRAADSALFFPEGTKAQIQEAEAAAKRVCGHCPIKARCLEWALESGQFTGVWGGLTEAERRGMVRGGDRQFEQCLENQEFIEQQLAAGKGQRAIAEELGLSYNILRRAIAYFAEERKQGLGVAA